MRDEINNKFITHKSKAELIKDTMWDELMHPSPHCGDVRDNPIPFNL